MQAPTGMDASPIQWATADNPRRSTDRRHSQQQQQQVKSIAPLAITLAPADMALSQLAVTSREAAKSAVRAEPAAGNVMVPCNA
jgi:hypothetical protein